MSLFRNLALILVSTLVGICLAELVLRAIKPAMEYPYMPQDIEMTHFRPSLYLPFELKANHNSRFRMLEYDTTVRTNGLGMRDEEIDWNKPRILCLGDSFTFGNGVENEETFCAILEDLFDKRYDFVNVGFAGGFSPDAYALWLAKNRKTLGPRGIVIAFYQNDYSDVLSNDWLRNGRRMDSSNADSPDQIISPGQIISSDGARIRDNAITRLPPPIRKLLRNSYVVGFLRDRLTKDLAAGAPSPNSSHPAGFSEDAKFLRALEILRSAAGDSVLAFYLIPKTGQAAPSHMDELVIAFGQQHGIAVLSNRADFTAQDYFPLDSHWTLSGHAKAAHFPYQALRDTAFLPASTGD